MSKRIPSLALACFLTASAGPANAGTVAVSFVHPETYTDASLSGGYQAPGERWTLDEIGRYLESLGTRYLKPQQLLTLEVLNVDLAGKIEWWRRFPYDLRVLRDVYPPRFTLHYRLVQGGRTLTEGQETVVDPNYLASPAVYFSTGDPLRFEKAMLADWFRARFGLSATSVSIR
jgi:DUF3016 family protein